MRVSRADGEWVLIVMRCDAERCSVLQCVAVCCSVLQCHNGDIYTYVVCRSVSQCVAVLCLNVSQCFVWSVS